MKIIRLLASLIASAESLPETPFAIQKIPKSSLTYRRGNI
jgi:hypothetical protein